MTQKIMGVGHPETIDFTDDMFNQIERLASEESMTVEEWIIAAVTEKVQRVSDTPESER